MKSKLHMSVLNNNGPSIEPWGPPDKISCHELCVSGILVLYLRDNHKQILQSRSYVENSQKLLKDRLVKSWRHVLGLQSPFTFQEELLGSAEFCDLAWNHIGV